MASYLGAIHALYESLAAANFPDGKRPRLFDGDELDSVAAGLAQFAPYVRLLDSEGRTPAYQSDSGGVETGGFTLEVYDRSRERVEQAVAALKYNGQAPGNRAGFDWGELALDPPGYHLSLKRKSERYAFPVLLRKMGPVLHWFCRLEYEAKAQIRASG